MAGLPYVWQHKALRMWDNLTALQPATMKEAQTVLFLHKLLLHIRNLINPRAFKEPEDLIKPLHSIEIISTQVAPSLFWPASAHGDWTRKNTTSPRRNSLQWEKQV
jgi:hypothetical protein